MPVLTRVDAAVAADALLARAGELELRVREVDEAITAAIKAAEMFADESVALSEDGPTVHVDALYAARDVANAIRENLDGSAYGGPQPDLAKRDVHELVETTRFGVGLLKERLQGGDDG